jgi:hypothetical protein
MGPRRAGGLQQQVRNSEIAEANGSENVSAGSVEDLCRMRPAPNIFPPQMLVIVRGDVILYLSSRSDCAIFSNCSIRWVAC